MTNNPYFEIIEYMARHHTVQNKYLTQWRKSDTENQLNIYVIPENEYKERGPDWKGFKRKDFNIIDDDPKNFYLPENIAANIDAQGIEIIRSIDCKSQSQFGGKKRSDLARYVTLQYIRTPRFREEKNEYLQEVTKYFMRKDITSPDKYKISKKEILKHKPKNEQEKGFLQKTMDMTEDEINKQTFDFIHSDNFKMHLSNTGHSKDILNIDRLAKKIFELQWLFLMAPNKTSFATSDNPCFTVSPTKVSQGPLSPHVLTFFPLRPDLCIVIKADIKSKNEYFLQLDRKEVRSINKWVLQKSYQCLVAKDRKQLEHLTKNYDYEAHRKSRNTAIYENGDYVMFNVE